jgi:tRNA pseudouridine38/39 synthase
MEVDVMNGAVEQEDGMEDMNWVNGEGLEVEAEKMSEKGDTFDPIKDELPYIALLNRVLPPTIRILAWCPSPPPNFSARFSCKERVYKYFFTNPAYLPFPSTNPPNQRPKEGYLGIAAMREAAAYLEGTHDFRNFCKVDATKQITNFKRRITQASIECLPTPAYLAQHSKSSDICPPQPNTYTFTVRGSAFLWHQVRCMVAVLFLVGQGLEKPEVVKELLDVERNPRRPQYEMASDKPLVLWECTFSASAQERYVGANGAAERDDEEVEHSSRFWDRGLGDDELEWVYADGENKWGRMGLMEDLWHGWRAAKLDEVLAGQLLDLVSSQGVPPAQSGDGADAERSTRVFQGDDAAKPVGGYVPVMQKERMDPVEVINAKYLVRKDARRSAATGVDEDDANE